MWKLIEINFRDDNQLLTEVFGTVLRVEHVVKPAQIYFAHYGGNSLLRISLDTELDNKIIHELLKNNLRVVMNVSVKNGDGPGSFIHALGYQICKQLNTHAHDSEREKLGDLFHWMQNMLGFDDAEEEANYLLWAENAKRNRQDRS
ncbi:MAG: hypothetical protein HY964_04565 [Ignavibacteriales bacterium]|nr:hypothetical protein [Ignavibacteriales bacterium]